MQNITCTCAGEGMKCACKFKSIHEMHIQQAGIKLSDLDEKNVLSSPIIRSIVPRSGKVPACLTAACTVSRKVFQCKLLRMMCPGGM